MDFQATTNIFSYCDSVCANIVHNVYCSYCILIIACSRPTIKSGRGVCVSLKYFLSYLFDLQCDDNLSDLIIQMSWSNAETFASSRQSSRSVCVSEVPYLSRKNYKTVPFHRTPTDLDLLLLQLSSELGKTLNLLQEIAINVQWL